MVLGLESLARHIYAFVGMFCPSTRIIARWMERTHCLRYQHSCWVATDLVDYRKVILCTTVRDCTLQRKSVWAVIAYFDYWRKNSDVSDEQVSVLYVVLTDYVCYAQPLCVLNIDANF